MTVKQRPLADAQLAVMDLLWRNERLTAREIREQLYPDATKAQHGTVQKLLQRLEDKGYVERDRRLSILLTHLVEEKKISRDEIARIRTILDEQEGEGEQS